MLEKALTEIEIKEYRSRIAILGAELNSKNEQIVTINREREELEELAG